MRNRKIIAVLGVCLALLGIGAALVVAGEVYTREHVTLSATGSATWTNTQPYAAVKLARIWSVANADTLTNTITITRVTSDLAYTQAVGTVSAVAGAGNTTTFTAGYLNNGDMLAFSSSSNAVGTMQVEYFVQKH